MQVSRYRSLTLSQDSRPRKKSSISQRRKFRLSKFGAQEHKVTILHVPDSFNHWVNMRWHRKLFDELYVWEKVCGL